MYRILIVDNDYAIRLLYQTELEDDGYTVMATNDCVSILKHIKEFRPDIILLDVGCGKIGGSDILEEVRARHSHIPVILCSAYDSSRRDMQAQGADYCVAKSIDLTELKSTIKSAFGSLMKKPKKFTQGYPEQNSAATYQHL